MSKFSLAIDESNHGRFPVIYFALVAHNQSDTAVRSDLEKLRRKAITEVIKANSLSPVVGKRDFRYILVPREYKREFGDIGVKIVVLSEFIRYFSSQESGDLERVLVDGELQRPIISETKKIVYPVKSPDIVPVAHGDQKIPAINMADVAAHYLFRYHTRHIRTPKTKKRPIPTRGYLEKILTPRIEDYAHLAGRWS